MINHSYGNLKMTCNYPSIYLEGKRIGTITSTEWDYQVRVLNWHKATTAAPFPTTSAHSIVEAMNWCAEAWISQQISSLRIMPPKQYTFTLKRIGL